MDVLRAPNDKNYFYLDHCDKKCDSKNHTVTSFSQTYATEIFFMDQF